jgi:hypothetical protein
MTKQLRKYFIFLGLFWVIFIVGVFVESAIADMYKWVDQNGVLHLLNMILKKTKKLQAVKRKLTAKKACLLL